MLREEDMMDFFWFFLGIISVALGLRYIKKTTPNQ